MKYKIGERVLVGDKNKGQVEIILQVYEQKRPDGSKYLALRNEDWTIYNGAVSLYEEGFWGGIRKAI